MTIEDSIGNGDEVLHAVDQPADPEELDSTCQSDILIRGEEGDLESRSTCDKCMQNEPVLQRFGGANMMAPPLLVQTCVKDGESLKIYLHPNVVRASTLVFVHATPLTTAKSMKLMSTTVTFWIDGSEALRCVYPDDSKPKEFQSPSFGFAEWQVLYAEGKWTGRVPADREAVLVSIQGKIELTGMLPNENMSIGDKLFVEKAEEIPFQGSLYVPCEIRRKR